MVALALGATVLFAQRAEKTTRVSVVSAGAVEEGVRRLSQQFEQTTGRQVSQQFGTGPEIEKQLQSDERADVLVAPAAVIERAVAAGRLVAETIVPVARVGVGITVRRGATPPDVSTVDALKAALVAADAVVYNQASTGQYLEQLFARMGIAEQLRPKTTRYGNAAQVLERIIAGREREIGFGPITEIKSFEPKGAVLVAPLPAEVQNFTTYAAAVMAGSPHQAVAAAFVRHLASNSARDVFAATGAQ